MFRQVTLIVFVGFLLLIATSYFFFSEEIPQTDTDSLIVGQNEKIIDINGHKLTVEIADEPNEQSLGLSYREGLGQNKGMLFVFSQPSEPPFWMKDMHFSLDMLWINSSGVIIAITENVSPDTYPQTFSPPSPILYVLEVSAGWSDENKIKVGAKVSF